MIDNLLYMISEFTTSNAMSVVQVKYLYLV
jgi:hypothetical protein